MTDQTTHLQLPGYNSIHHNRKGKIGGGIGLYARTQWQITTLATSDPIFDNNPEYINTELRHKSHIILIAVVYRRPDAASPTDFFETLSPYLGIYKNIIITGDFNADLQSPRSPDTRNLSEIVESHALSFVSRSPTHHRFQTTHQSHTTLNLFITKKIAAYHLFFTTIITFRHSFSYTTTTRPPRV